MGLLKAVVDLSSKVLTAKKLIQVYLVLSNIKYCDRELTFLAYYALYGISKATDKRIQKEYLHHLNSFQARQITYNVKSNLKKFGLLSYDPIQRVYDIIPALKAGFAPTTNYGFVIKFNL